MEGNQGKDAAHQAKDEAKTEASKEPGKNTGAAMNRARESPGSLVDGRPTRDEIRKGNAKHEA